MRHVACMRPIETHKSETLKWRDW